MVDKACWTDITPVIDAYQHAILGRFPRARYLVGLDLRLVIIPLSYLPEWIFDSVVGFIGFLQPVPGTLKKKIE